MPAAGTGRLHPALRTGTGRAELLRGPRTFGSATVAARWGSDAPPRGVDGRRLGFGLATAGLTGGATPRTASVPPWRRAGLLCRGSAGTAPSRSPRPPLRLTAWTAV